jgi:hypothetical protein
VVDEDEAVIVRRVFREYAAGTGTNSIVKGLNDDGIKPRRAATFNGMWLLRLIRNPMYMGILRYGLSTLATRAQRMQGGRSRTRVAITLEAAVLARVREVLAPGNRKLLLGSWRRQNQERMAAVAAELKRARVALAQAGSKRARIDCDYGNGDLPAKLYAAQVERLDHEEQALAAAASALSAERTYPKQNRSRFSVMSSGRVSSTGRPAGTGKAGPGDTWPTRTRSRSTWNCDEWRAKRRRPELVSGRLRCG